MISPAYMNPRNIIFLILPDLARNILSPHLDLHDHEISKIKEKLKNADFLQLISDTKKEPSKFKDYYHREDLQGRNLQFANFNRTTLYNVDFRDASLAGASLNNTMLQAANLEGADLQDADLTYANLTGADLTGANLRKAYLRDVDLSRADLTDAIIRQNQLDQACGSKVVGLPKRLSVNPCPPMLPISGIR